MGPVNSPSVKELENHLFNVVMQLFVAHGGTPAARTLVASTLEDLAGEFRSAETKEK
jgi:hypothetical protein